MTHAEYTDEAVLDNVRRAAAAAAAADHAAATLPRVMAAGRSRRRRRRLRRGGLAGVGLVLGAALTITSLQAGGGRNVSLSAWSVHTAGDGIVTLDLRHFSDLDQLQHTLAVDGIPALLTRAQRQCSADWAPNRNGMINAHRGSAPTASQPVTLPGAPRWDFRILVDPAEMPQGFELDISAAYQSHIRPLRRGPQTAERIPGAGRGGHVAFRSISIVKIGDYPDCR